MRIFTTSQLRELDRIAIERYQIPSHSLMEVAGQKLFEEIKKVFQFNSAFVLLGRGNNGGDGLVISRLILLNKIPVTILLTEELSKCSEDFRKNYEILLRVSHNFPFLKILDYNSIDDKRLECELRGSDLIVDALLGTGIRSELKSPYNRLIPFVNSLNISHKIVSVDIPSGLNGDTGSPSPDAIRANLTITIGGGKVGLFSYPAQKFTGEVRIIDIGLPLGIIEGPVMELADMSMYKGMLKRGDPNFHKGSGGHIGVVAGSRLKKGAAYLAVLGALKGGAGLITLISERTVIEGITIRHPEVMTRELDFNIDTSEAIERLLTGIDTLVIGPGLPEEESAQRWIKGLIENWKGPMVLDAEAFKVIKGMKFAEEKVVLTPHPAELSRLIDVPRDEIQRDRTGYATKCAELFNAVVVLKGARSVIARPSGDLTINTTGNPFMASGGMGDLLSGLIGAFLYQTGSSYNSARLAVYIHGLAADIAIKEGRSPQSASDVASFIQEAMALSGIYE